MRALIADNILKFGLNRQDCDYPSVEAYTVTYEDEVVTLLKFSNYLPSSVEIETSSGELMGIYALNSNSLLLHNLKKDANYTIKANNSCHQLVTVGDIYTYKTSDAIYVPEQIFNALAHNTERSGETKFYDIVVNDESIGLWEKTAILQDFYFKGHPMPNNLKGAIPSKVAISSLINTCECGLVMSRATKEQLGTRNGNIIDPEISPNKTTTFGRRGEVWKASSSHGPARYVEIIQDSKREKDNVTYSDKNDWSVSNSIFASLRYHLYCERIVGQTPTNCTCERPVLVKWSYNSEVLAEAQEFAKIYNARAGAVADDAAIVTMINEKTDQIDVLAASGWRASSECQVTMNPDFLTNTLNAGEAIFKNFSKVKVCAAATAANPIAGAGCQIITSIIKKQKEDDMIKKIKTLIQTPIRLPSNCDVQTKAGGFSGGTFITLRVGEPVEIMLSSLGQLDVLGKRTWKSRARILSNYSLAGVVQSGVMPGKPHCCTRAIADWTLASVPDAPVSISSLLTNVGTDIRLNSSSWTTPLNPLPRWYSGMNPPLGTDVCGINQIPIQGKMSNNSNEIVDTIDDNKMIDNRTSTYVEMLDMTGKLLFNQKENKSYDEIKQSLLYNQNLPAGVYILRSSNSLGEIKSERIFVH